MSKAGDAAIRISNVERDEAVSTLGEHLSTGRLELDEYEERCGKAVAARTRGDLEELFTDLPAPHPDLSSATPPAQLTRKAGQLVRDPGDGRRSKELVRTRASDAFGAAAGLTFLLGVPGVILLTIFQGGWWLFIPLGIVLFVTIALSEGRSDRPTRSRGPTRERPRAGASSDRTA